LLGEVGSYDEVLTLVDLESASAVKEALSVFVKKHQKSAVDEVFFYFSGHGLFTSRSRSPALSSGSHIVGATYVGSSSR